MIKDIGDFIAIANSYQISEFCVDPNLDEVRICFTCGPGCQDVCLDLFGVALYKISKSPGDDGCFVIGNLNIVEAIGESSKVLDSLQYAIKNDEGKSYPLQGKCYHLSIDGDLVCDIVFSAYKLFIEI